MQSTKRQTRPEERGFVERAAPAPAARRVRGLAAVPWLMYGIYMFCLGMVMHLAGVILVVPRYLLGLDVVLRPVAEWLVWYSGAPIVFGIALALIDLLHFFDAKRPDRIYREDSMRDAKVTVALTAYNDEDSIGRAVRDFLSHPRVARVIVVSNNSTDRTLEIAQRAGAVAIDERRQGYGRCVYRCYEEALEFEDADLIVLCEGDRTFRAADIDKLVAYSPHADVVNGTRIVEALRERSTQLTTFMFYGNLFVAKLLEAKHLGCTTLTDVGSTYKLVRRRALKQILAHLDPSVNLEFNAHFMDRAIGAGFTLIECPITFHPRVGISKGGNVNNSRALKVGLGMMRGLTCGWRGAR